MNQNNDDGGNLISVPNITNMSANRRLPRDIRINANNTISNNAQRRLRRLYNIDLRGLNTAQQRQAINNAARGIRGGTTNFRNTTFAYRFLARNYNDALVPIRENIRRNRLAAIQSANEEVVLNFTLQYIGFNQANQAIKTATRNYTTTIKRKDQNAFIEEKKIALANQLRDSPTKRAEVRLIKKDNIDIIDPNPLQWTPIMTAGVMNLDNNVLNNEWCKNRNMCVVDLIQYRYSNRNGFKKKCKDEESIEYWATHNYEEGNSLTGGSWTSYYPDIEIKKKGLMNPNKTGYTLKHIKCWCKNLNVNMYCLIDGKLVDFYYDVKARKKKNPPLVFELKNNHMYPILETNKIKAITNNKKLKDLEKAVKSDNQQENKKEKETTDFGIEFLDRDLFDKCANNTYLEYACEKMVQSNTMVYPANNLKLFNRGMSSFKIGNDKHLLYEDVKPDEECLTKTALMKNKNLRVIKNYCKKKGINFQGQTAPFFIAPYMKDFSKLYSSYFAADVDKALEEDNVKNRTHSGTKFLGSYDNLRYLWEHTNCYDINKCYRSVMENPAEDWMNIKFYNTITTKIPEDKIKPLGLYFLETQDVSLLHYSNWYSSAMVNYATEEGIDFTITGYIKADGFGKNALMGIINKIKNDFDDKGLQKLLINCIYGYLMKTHNTQTLMSVDEDVNRVWDTYIKVRGKKNQSLLMEKIETSTGKVLYCYGKQKKTKIMNNNLPMGIQITDQANIKLHKMIKKMKGTNGTLLYRNTDCAVVGFDNPADIIELETDDKVGGISLCDKPLLENVYCEKKNDRAVLWEAPEEIIWNDIKYNDSDDWMKIINNLVTNGGGMLLGRAGTGKSYVAKEGMKWLKEAKKMTTKCLAFTNKATIQLNGSTIHKFMTIDADGKLNAKWAMEQSRNIDVIMVDEISMIGSELWKILSEFHYYTNIPFILIGDFRQLPPVNDKQLCSYGENWFNHPTIMSLANGNRCELTQMKRYDGKLWDLLEEVCTEKYTESTLKFLRSSSSRSIEELIKHKNITYCNNTRKAINRIVQNHLTKDMTDFIEMPYKGEENKYNQDAVLFKGMKLIMYLTTKCKTFKKNEEVKVIDFTEKNITISNGTKEATFDYINKVKTNLFHKMFLLGYATTIHKSQGDTINGNINIFDVPMIQEWLKDKRALYTALSRARSLKNIKISHFQHKY